MNAQHTNAQILSPCPIGRRRRKAIAAAALVAVGLASGAAYADEPVSVVGVPPVLWHRTALPVVNTR